ncbi:protein tyrosine phosphatase family protein [Altericroceibacterium xinjiangense]|uniref:protein tyrosine phosphatase family protein n=1 Tax=Altericroceibacterium xinjiangense TaxID=762261 RepID=UPI000F7EDB4D|nr:protein tyrosine phosphatase family protein [Altericroceibacterium xinjiangense]
MPPDPEDIRNWLRLSPRITTSGRLEDKDLARLAATGVRHVINLALANHPEALDDEGGKLAAYGIRYTHIPVLHDAPREEHYRAFVAALKADDEPLHVHCIMNFRVSAFFYRYHTQACDMAEPQARMLLERVWSPHAADHPTVKPWRDFVTKRES